MKQKDNDLISRIIRDGKQLTLSVRTIKDRDVEQFIDRGATMYISFEFFKEVVDSLVRDIAMCEECPNQDKKFVNYH